MTDQTNFLSQEYTIDTPENVTFAYEIAGIGNRFIAALVDTTALAVTLVILVLILLVLLGGVEGADQLVGAENESLGWFDGLILAVYALLNFIVIWGYYIFFEYIWNGQSPGKRLVNIRVVRTDGNPVGLSEVVIRNLVRIVDFLPSGYGVGLVVMFFNRQSRRLGDLAAGTLVVKERRDVALETLTTGAGASSAGDEATTPQTAALDYPNIRNLTVQDYELIGDVLARYERGDVGGDVVHRLAVAVATKLALSPRPSLPADRFLQQVQRTYRQIKR